MAFIFARLFFREAFADCVYVSTPEVATARPEVGPALALEITRLLRQAGHGTSNFLELGYVLTDRERLLQVGLTHRVTAAVFDVSPQTLDNVTVWNIHLAVARIELKTGLETWANTVQWRESMNWIERPQPLVEKIGQALEMVLATYPKGSVPSRVCWRSPGTALSKLDRDRDGIPDQQDRCPDVPEDVNGYQDTDGCPKNLPLVELRVRSSDGQPLDASVRIARAGTTLQNAEGKFLFPLEPGAYDLEIFSDGYETQKLSVTVPLKRALDVSLTARAVIEPVQVVPEARKTVRSRPTSVGPETAIDAEEVLLIEANRICASAENRNCLNALDAYLARKQDPGIAERRAKVAQIIESKVNDLYERGLNAFRLERIDEAITAWGDALKLDPENRKVREAFEKAERIQKWVDRSHEHPW